MIFSHIKAITTSRGADEQKKARVTGRDSSSPMQKFDVYGPSGLVGSGRGVENAGFGF